MQSASAAKGKLDVIIDNLTRLATAYNEPLTPDRIEVYTIALADLLPDELSHGFNRALRETKWWPKPSELIEFCTGRAAAMADKLTIDAAWNWTLRYIELFGVPAAKRWEIQGYIYHGLKLNSAIRNFNTVRTLATTAPYYEVTSYAVPEIPEFVRQTLTAMSGTIRMGLTRIKDSTSRWNSSEEAQSTSKDAAFLRRDWDEYCSRVIAANCAQTPFQINPGLQLSGDVAPMLPAFTSHTVPATVVLKEGEYTVDHLEFASAQRLYKSGQLPQALYDDAVSRNEWLQQREQLRNMPCKYNAVYRGVYDSDRIHHASEPWPPLGRFTVESSDGSRIVFDDLPMAVGNLTLKPGQILNFTAAPKELAFSIYPRQFYNLNPAPITNSTGELTMKLTTDHDQYWDLGDVTPSQPHNSSSSQPHNSSTYWPYSTSEPCACAPVAHPDDSMHPRDWKMPDNRELLWEQEVHRTNGGDSRSIAWLTLYYGCVGTPEDHDDDAPCRFIVVLNDLLQRRQCSGIDDCSQHDITASPLGQDILTLWKLRNPDKLAALPTIYKEWRERERQSIFKDMAAEVKESGMDITGMTEEEVHACWNDTRRPRRLAFLEKQGWPPEKIAELMEEEFGKQ